MWTEYVRKTMIHSRDTKPEIIICERVYQGALVFDNQEFSTWNDKYHMMWFCYTDIYLHVFICYFIIFVTHDFVFVTHTLIINWLHCRPIFFTLSFILVGAMSAFWVVVSRVYLQHSYESLNNNKESYYHIAYGEALIKLTIGNINLSYLGWKLKNKLY